MKKTLEEKLQMCKEHVDEGKSFSHVSEIHIRNTEHAYLELAEIDSY